MNPNDTDTTDAVGKVKAYIEASIKGNDEVSKTSSKFRNIDGEDERG